MFIIREAQMQAMRDVLGPQLFEVAMAKHLRATHGSRFRQEGAAELQERIRRVMRLSAGYGITAFPDCAKFLELALEFGDLFPSGLGWAEECLAATAGQTGALRTQALMDSAASHLNAIEEGHANDAKVNGEMTAEMSFDDQLAVDADDFEPDTSGEQTPDKSSPADEASR